MAVTAGIITRGEDILICQRGEGSWGEYRWEFPGGKVEEGEEPRESLYRELKEELGVEPEIGRLLCRVLHRYSEREVELYIFHVPRYCGEVRNRQFAALRWVRREELADFDFLDADRPVIEALATGRLLQETG